MAQLFSGNGIDTDKVEDSGGDCLPAGQHLVRITATEVTPTKAGTGVILTLELTVEEGALAGRKMWERLNISNPNPTAQKIGQGMLKQIVKATGAPAHLTDSDQLRGLMFVASTKVDSDSYGEKAVLKSAKAYTNPVPPQRPATTGQAPTGGQTIQANQASQGPADGGMPWNQ